MPQPVSVSFAPDAAVVDPLRDDPGMPVGDAGPSLVATRGVALAGIVPDVQGDTDAVAGRGACAGRLRRRASRRRRLACMSLVRTALPATSRSVPGKHPDHSCCPARNTRYISGACPTTYRSATVAARSAAASQFGKICCIAKTPERSQIASIRARSAETTGRHRGRAVANTATRVALRRDTERSAEVTRLTRSTPRIQPRGRQQW